MATSPVDCQALSHVMVTGPLAHWQAGLVLVQLAAGPRGLRVGAGPLVVSKPPELVG